MINVGKQSNWRSKEGNDIRLEPGDEAMVKNEDEVTTIEDRRKAVEGGTTALMGWRRSNNGNRRLIEDWDKDETTPLKSTTED